MNGTKYRCVSPRTERNCPWGGSWEWWNEWFQRWDRVINYNHKTALNKIVESNNPQNLKEMIEREIKFRGKLSHSGEWIEGNLIIANNGSPYIIPTSIFEPDGHHLRIESDSPFWVISETVGQFTGLLDKSGKEIYEGDILENTHNFSNDPYITYNQVTFNEYSFGIIGEITGKFIPFSDFEITSEIVIGNIYDNPELIPLP